ncbi:MAG TPA: ATP-binding protein [Planctomycetota bacterium]|nr:ATP-binding protein [Planctomycetota bacterium]
MKRPSIRRRLILVGMAVCAGVLGLACLGLLVHDATVYRKATQLDLAGLAEGVALQCRAALAGGDAAAAHEILQALRARPDVVQARLEGPDGRLFASYRRARPSPGGAHADFTLLAEGRPQGKAVVVSDLSHRQRSVTRMLAAGAGVLSGALFLSFILMARLERRVTDPVLHLARTVKRVTEERDYGVRAVKTTGDEIGLLIDGFNDMLAQIQARDEALRMARDRLEERVQERTSEIQRTNAALEAEIRQRGRSEDALRESEDRYRRLFESSPDAILILSEGAVSLVNPAAVRIFGFASTNGLVGEGIEGRIHPGARGALAARFREAGRGWAVGPFDDRWLRADGTSFDGESIVIPFIDRGEPIFQIILRDITRRKEADRLKNEFVSTVSHELRTPLTALRGALALLGSGKLGAISTAARPFLDIANADCLRLIRLINDLLDIQKIEAGRMDFRMKRLELMPLVRRALETSLPFGEQNGVRLAVATGVEDAVVLGDADRLLQVLGNLLSNAVKFSPRGAGVLVSVRRREGGFRISVADRGPGIPESFRGRVFERFAQADGSDARQKGGTGLGLHICRVIVERHGGTIGFDSEPGLGTTFHVDLPETQKRGFSDIHEPRDADEEPENEGTGFALRGGAVGPELGVRAREDAPAAGEPA